MQEVFLHGFLTVEKLCDAENKASQSSATAVAEKSENQIFRGYAPRKIFFYRASVRLKGVRAARCEFLFKKYR